MNFQLLIVFSASNRVLSSAWILCLIVCTPKSRWTFSFLLHQGVYVSNLKASYWNHQFSFTYNERQFLRGAVRLSLQVIHKNDTYLEMILVTINQYYSSCIWYPGLLFLSLLASVQNLSLNIYLMLEALIWHIRIVEVTYIELDSLIL